MSTQVVLDDDLLERALQVAPAKSVREVIDLALREFVARHGSRDAAPANALDRADAEVLRPLPKFPGRVPSGWKDAIYDPQG
jgi:Arc/MetJ family transcription regulator